MKYVLDTSAVLSGKDFSGEELFTSPRIADEIRHGKMRQKLDYLLEGKMRILLPSDQSLERIRGRAKETGDIGRLSEADMEILALALELDAIILTDDYSIQNVAEVLGIKYQGIAQENIKERIDWTYRCKGCGRYFEEHHGECPVCGSPLKSARKK